MPDRYVSKKLFRSRLVRCGILVLLLLAGFGCGSGDPESQADTDAVTIGTQAGPGPDADGKTVTVSGEYVCDNGGQRAIFLRTDFDGYRPGDQAEIILVNNSQNFVSYDYCSLDLVLQHCEADGWKSYDLDWSPPNYGAGEDCTLGWQGMGPGGGARPIRVSLPDDLPVGTYRFAHKVGVGGLPWEDPDPDPQIVWSDPFEVRDRESLGNDICSSGAERTIFLTTDSLNYKPGDRPQVTLVNQSQDSVLYGACFEAANLEHLEADGWSNFRTSLSEHSDFACVSIGLMMGPGGSSEPDDVFLQPDLPAGTYRLIYTVDIGGPTSPYDFGHRRVACSDPFEVVEPDDSP